MAEGGDESIPGLDLGVSRDCWPHCVSGCSRGGLAPVTGVSFAWGVGMPWVGRCSASLAFCPSFSSVQSALGLEEAEGSAVQ